MTKKKYKIYNLPQRLTIEDYQQCCDIVVNEAKKNNNVTAVYLMGGKWCPGISDLDIVIVYKHNSMIKPVRSIWGLSEKADFILTHRYLSFFEEDFKDIYYLYPKKTVNLRLLWGNENIYSKDPSKIFSTEDIKLLYAFILFDVLVNKLLLFAGQQNEELNVRKTISELQSLIYTSYMIHTITGKTIGSTFTTKIQELRNQWFDNSVEYNLKQLPQFLTEGIDLVLESVNILDEFLIANKLYFKWCNNEMFLNKKFHIIFNKTWTKDKFLKNFRKKIINKDIPIIGRKIENYSLLLPSSFIYFFMIYSAGEGGFSSLIRSHFHIRSRTNISVPKIISDHVMAMNKSFDSSLGTNGALKTPFSFGFSLSKKGNMVIWLMENFLLLLRKMRI